MLYLRDLRVRLQERRNRLYKTGYQHHETELRFLLEFLDSNPYIRSLLATIEANASVGFEQWVADQSTSRQVRFPGSEDGRAKVCYGILKLCASDPEEQESLNWGNKFSSSTRFDDMLSDLNEAVLDPLVNYLHDRIDEAGNVLFLIERFKLKAEWFRRDELYRLYRDNTAVGESKLDQELRESLFDGGIDYPFSEPSSPSGKADVVALLGSDDPMVLEVKVFDPELSKDKGHIVQGFHQVLRYASDYNQNVGYLVVFDCSLRMLTFSSENASEGDFPPRVTHAGKTFFLISIDIRPDRPSASREAPTNRTEVSYADLVAE